MATIWTNGKSMTLTINIPNGWHPIRGTTIRQDDQLYSPCTDSWTSPLPSEIGSKTDDYVCVIRKD